MFITAKRIISQCKVKILQKKFPCINLRVIKFSWLLSCLICDRHVQIGLASLSFAPLGAVQIPRRTAALAHFVTVNKGARQFYQRLSQKFELVDRSTSEQFFFLKFQNNCTAEFKTNSGYGLLLQQFLWTFSGIFIISVKADTRNFSQNYQQFFFTRRDFL